MQALLVLGLRDAFAFASLFRVDQPKQGEDRLRAVKVVIPLNAEQLSLVVNEDHIGEITGAPNRRIRVMLVPSLVLAGGVDVAPG